jgi:hypothetical protein
MILCTSEKAVAHHNHRPNLTTNINERLHDTHHSRRAAS